MKAEKLKLIAEKIYPDVVTAIESGEVWFLHYPSTDIIIFNPMIDNNQIIDIEEYFFNLAEIISVENFRMGEMYTCYLCSYIKRSFSASGNTRAEALCEAAFSFFQCNER